MKYTENEIRDIVYGIIYYNSVPKYAKACNIKAEQVYDVLKERFPDLRKKDGRQGKVGLWLPPLIKWYFDMKEPVTTPITPYDDAPKPDARVRRNDIKPEVIKVEEEDWDYI